MDLATLVGRYGNRSTSSSLVEPVSTKMVRIPASMPETMSVSIRSPIIMAVSECASMAFSADRIMSGLGLPTKYGRMPVAWVIKAAKDPHAGTDPSADGPVGSGLVAMNRAPRSMSLMARVMFSKECV